MNKNKSLLFILTFLLLFNILTVFNCPVASVNDSIDTTFSDNYEFKYFNSVRSVTYSMSDSTADHSTAYKLLVAAVTTLCGVVITTKEVLDDACSVAYEKIKNSGVFSVKDSMAYLKVNSAVLNDLLGVFGSMPKDDVFANKTVATSDFWTQNGTNITHSGVMEWNKKYSIYMYNLDETRSFSFSGNVTSKTGTKMWSVSSVTVSPGDKVSMKFAVTSTDMGTDIRRNYRLNIYVNDALVKQSSSNYVWDNAVADGTAPNVFYNPIRLDISNSRLDILSDTTEQEQNIPYSTSDFTTDTTDYYDSFPAGAGTLSVPVSAPDIPDVSTDGLTYKDIEDHVSSTTDGSLNKNSNDDDDNSPSFIVIPDTSTNITSEDLSDQTGSLLDGMSQLGTSIKDFFASIYTQFFDLVRSILNKLNLFYEYIKSILSPYFDSVLDYLKSIVNALSPYFNSVLDYLSNFKTMMENKFGIEIPDISFLEIVPTKLVEFVTDFKSFVSELPSTIREIPDLIHKKLTEIGTFIVTIPDRFTDTIETLKIALDLWFDDVVKSAHDAAEQTKTEIKEQTKETTDNLKDLFIPTVEFGDLIHDPNEDDPMESFDFSPLWEIEPKEFTWEGDITIGNTTHHLFIAPFRVGIVANNLDTMRKVFTYALFFLLILSVIRSFEPTRVVD